MRRSTRWSLLFPILLVGCDSEREPPPAVEDTVFDAEVRALDRAREVQEITEEQEKKLRKAIEDAEGG